MRHAALLLCVACGSQQSAPATATATATATDTPTATATATATDTSPPSIGNRHTKVGNGWFLSGGGKDAYEAIYEPGNDPRVVVKQQSDPMGRWMTLMKNVAAAPYIGRVRVSVKTQGVTGRGELWARTARPHSPEDAPSTTTKLPETAEMTPYEVVIDVPDGSRVIEYGVSLAGPGQFWVGRDAIDTL